jgi:predicted neuraminidase
MVKPQRFWLWCYGLCVAAVGVDGVQRWSSAPLQPANALMASAGAAAKPASLPVITLQASGKIPMPADTPAAHASSLVVMPPGGAAQVLAFWFAGQRESAPNVQIAFSWFDRAAQAWVPSRFVVNRFALGQQLGYGVRRLGNPVAWLDVEGRVHVFVVATGLGGWAAGRIVHLRQDSDAVASSADALSKLQFSPVRMLPLSWLFNTSHLVRTAPMPLADGGMVLPVYFELGLKYPVALRFGAQGQWLGMTRMSTRTDILQPAIVPITATQWVGWMRDHGAQRKVAAVGTDDAGATWRDMPSLSIDNTGSSVAALRLLTGQFVMAHNKSMDTRRDMDLSASVDGNAWRSVTNVENGAKESDEFSYPALAWDGQSLWLSYTDMRREIAWRRYSVGTSSEAITVGAKP